jgi:hypothetical protein
MYLTHPNSQTPDSPAPDAKKPAYLAGFLRLAGFAFFGSGGIASIRRNTAFMAGSALGFLVMAGV